VTTAAHKKQVRDALKVKTSSMRTAKSSKKSSKKSPPKKVSVPKRNSPPKKKAGKKSPSKKVSLPKCLKDIADGKSCDDGKKCRIHTGNCVKSKPKGDEKYEYAGEEFFVTTAAHKKQIRDTLKTPTSMKTARTPSIILVDETAKTPSEFLERMRSVETDESDETSEEFSDEISDSDDGAVLSREELANINAQKRLILNILDKCPN